MQVRTIGNLNYSFSSKTEKPSKVQQKSVIDIRVAPYTLEDMRANYLIFQKEGKPTLKSVLKKHNLPRDIFRKYAYKKENVSQEMIEVFDKLNAKVVEHLVNSDSEGDLIPKLLTKSGEFETFWDYQGIPNLLNLFSTVQANGETLLSQLDDFSFIADEDFDVTEWELFISLFDSKKEGEEKTYLERFLNKNSFSDLFYSKEFSPSDVIAVRDKIEISLGLGNYNPDRFFKVMDLISNIEGSKYNQSEKIQALNYFLGLKTENGEKLFDVQNPRHSKMSTYEYLMNIDPTSVEASNMQMLIELVQAGVVGKHVFEFLPSKAKITPNIAEDIDKLYNAYISGKAPIDEFIPTFKNIIKASEQLSVGDVYEIEGEDFIYIINNEYSSTQLQLTKQKYFELFPPIERFGTTQNQIGNCWEISVLQGIFSNPKTRQLVLRLFSQEGEKLVVEYPNGNYGKVVFPSGQLPIKEDLSGYSQGAKGFQLLEYADGKEVQDAKIREYIRHVSSLEPELAKIKMGELEEMIDYYGGENIFLDYSYKDRDWVIEEYQKTPSGYDNAEIMGRDGGYSLNLLIRLGLKQAEELMTDDDNFDDFLNNLDNFNSHIVIWTTNRNEELCEERELTDGHAYFISSANVDENGKIIDYNVINPWGIVEQRLTLDELKEYGSAIIYGGN